MIHRRDLLRTLGFAGLGLGAGAFALRSAGRRQHPQTFSRDDGQWGRYPAEARSSQLAEEDCAQSVLEIFLYGGISPWETFYAVDEPDYGKAAKEMWWTFHDGPESVEEVSKKCLVAGGQPLLKDFTRDQNGVMVKFGPFVEALRERRDITDRLRLHVLSHDLMVHEIAVPLALTGYRISIPRLAGVGTAAQHYFLPRDSSAREPLAYVIAPYHRIFTPVFSQASAAGAHPGYARPLALQANGNHQFIEALRRRSLGDRPEASDALLREAVDEYKTRLVRDGESTRSRVWDEYQYAADMLHKSNALAEVFEPSLWSPVSGESCGQHAEQSVTAMQLRLAAHLLGREGSPTRHVTVVDPGLLQDINDFGYDTHRRHIFDSGRNLSYFMRQLTSYINKPGEKDPTKVDLERTMVIVNTEFGRTPMPQGTDGRNHWPQCYVTAMFGGPIGPKQRGIVGAIDHHAGAIDPLGPAETRAASLAALGIWPFSAEGYSVSDMRGVKTTAEAAARVKEKVLGVA